MIGWSSLAFMVVVVGCFVLACTSPGREAPQVEAKAQVAGAEGVVAGERGMGGEEAAVREHRIASGVDGSVVMAVGERLLSTHMEHGSVGYTGAWTIGDEEVLRLDRREVAWKHPEKMAEGMSGADEADVTLVFEAVSRGQTQLTLEGYFRGELESRQVIEVSVR